MVIRTPSKMLYHILVTNLTIILCGFICDKCTVETFSQSCVHNDMGIYDKQLDFYGKIMKD
ncbi:hypothetical protein GCM10008013_33710 [Paenibacillus segetis]|uniref:Uncharacterized protein n=1 Tax=Paenibacillus segetis TaxID=1325360 RepID=A0ABQ1YN41_9BACL|nr:hypothetical protein GCM10008013_33710 [Paenibacillus segetis]